MNCCRKDKYQIEQHTTAAWANYETLKPESLVPIPSDTAVEQAKEWVDVNQK